MKPATEIPATVAAPRTSAAPAARAGLPALLALLTAFPATAAAASRFNLDITPDAFKPGEIVAGPPVDGEAVKGKVVVILFWNQAFPLAAQGLDKFPVWAREHVGVPMLFVAAHKGDVPQTVIRDRAAPWSEGVTICEKWSLDKSPEVPLPHAIVFDPRGRCVFRGLPRDADAAVKQAVQKAPLMQVDPKAHPVFFQLAVELNNGQPPFLVAQTLQGKVNSNDFNTRRGAQAFLDRIEAVAAGHADKADGVRKKDPLLADAYYRLIKRSFGAVDTVKRANTALREMETDPAVTADKRAAKMLEDIWRLEGSLRAGKTGLGDPRDEAFIKANKPTLDKIAAGVKLMKKGVPESVHTKTALQIAAVYAIAITE